MVGIDEKKLRELVAEEVQRSDLRELLSRLKPAATSFWDKFFRHPLTLAVATFLLTSGLLFGVERILDLRQQERAEAAEAAARDLARRTSEKERISQEADLAIQRLDELVLLAHRRATEASLLLWAIEDGDADAFDERRRRYYETYREWVTTYQPRNRQIVQQMGVDLLDRSIAADPFYVAVEGGVGWRAFWRGHECMRNAIANARAVAYTPATAWADADGLQCRLSRYREWLPFNDFIRNRYTDARACATDLYFYGSQRIRAYEHQRKLKVDNPDHEVVLPDPQEGFPPSCDPDKDGN